MILDALFLFIAGVLATLVTAFLPVLPTLSAQDYSALANLTAAAGMWNQVINATLIVELLGITFAMKTAMVGWRAFNWFLGRIPLLH